MASDAVFAVCCEMPRCGCQDQEITEILLEANNGISDHVLEQNDPEQYARRQVDRARVKVAENDTEERASVASHPDRWPNDPGWPLPLGIAAFHGLAGDIVRAIEPHSEADPAALLIQFLVAFGNIVGRSNCYRFESTLHYPNLFAVLAGDTSKARKGTSWARIRALFAERGGDWTKRIQTGLSSGEGLIAAVQDPVIKVTTDKETGEVIEEVIDPGVADKRLLVVEEEFARLLSVMARGGNIVSPLVRNSWDGLDLQTMTKVPMRATAPHISIIAHSTIDELKRNLTLTEAANGFGNRFLFTCVKRSKLLPFGGEPDRDTMSELEFRLAERLNAAIDRNPARPPRVLGFDQPATELWCQIYGTLSAPTPGLLGAVIARAEAQVVRLALVYALLDGAEAIGQVHLEAALELWIYCEDSAGTWMMYMDNLTTKAQQRFLPAAKVKSLISIHPGSLMGEQTRCI